MLALAHPMLPATHADGFPIIVAIIILFFIVGRILSRNRRHLAQTTMTLCKSCGTSHPNFARFCRSCGRTLDQ
jgi:hypothetical protein